MITSLRLPPAVYFSLTTLLLLLLLLRSDFAGCEYYEFNDPFGSTLRTGECNVLDYGAVGDGVRYDTAAIQTAINVCASDGGGRVLLPSERRYITGTIYLTSGVTLVVAKGATLLGSPRRRDYPADSRQWYVILAVGAYEVGITGGGIIDGQGSEFVERFDERKNVMVSWNETGSTCEGDECRPRLVGFVNCRNVRVWDVLLMNPAYWCLHVVRSNQISIQDIEIHGDFNTPNNDGIDIEDSNNTIITRCNINTGDDAICPKTTYGPLYNLTATDCWIRTKSSAVKLGSASWFNFENLLFDNIKIHDSHRGLAVQIRDGGNVDNVVFSNIEINTRYYDPSWWGRAEPIYVTSCPRDHHSVAAGSVSNIKFVNISALSENGIFLSGSSGRPLMNIGLNNVSLNYKRWTNFPGGLVDYRPGCMGLVNLSSAGIFMEHVSGLTVKDLRMNWSAGDLESWTRPLESWTRPLEFSPSTVDRIYLNHFQSSVA